MQKNKKWKIRSGGISLLCLCLVMTMNLAAFSLPVQASSSFVVVLDPGHDSIHARGANAASGIVEEDMNLEIAKACKKELEAAGIQVYMTRDSEECPVSEDGGTNEQCLAWRTAYAASVGCDLYVSIHLNASGSNNGEYRKANGSIVFISSHQSYQASLQKLAEGISSNLKTDCGISSSKSSGTTIQSKSKPGYDDGSLSDYYMVIRDSCYNGFPAILIEHAYMDNWMDAQQLKNRGANAFGKADAQAIISWYQNGTEITQTSAPSAGNIASGYVNYDFLNLRISPGTGSSLVTRLSQNDPVYIYGTIGEWYRVIALHDGVYYEGFVNCSYITKDTTTRYPEVLLKASGNLTKVSKTESNEEKPEPEEQSSNSSEEKASGQTGYVNFTYLNVRSGPGTSYEKIDKLDHKQTVTIKEELADWYKITYYSEGNEKTGYVAARYITEN